MFAAGFQLLVVIQAHLLRSFGLSWKIALADSALTYACLGIGSILMINNLRYYLPRHNQAPILAAWTLALSAGCTFAVQKLLNKLFRAETAYIELLDSSYYLRLWGAVLLISWVAAVSVMWYRQQQHTEAEKRKSDAEKLARDAELYKLRQQLQPHFLFNSLNSISALAGSQPELARKMIHQLSEFLRGTLKKEEHQWVSLHDELQHLSLYLEIEKVRFGHRLSTELITDETTSRMQLPPMLLQPVVENAIKFGLYDTTGSITVQIKAQAQDGHLVIEVKNPFDPETSAPRQGTGFGLSSVQRRLYLLFARNDLLNTSAAENMFTTIVKIPQHDQGNINR